MATPMKLHVWGPVGTSLSFSADCLAATWYLQLTGQDFLLVQSSNEGIAHELPALETEGKTIGGAQAIIRYLKSTGADLDEQLSTQEQIKNTALVAYMTTKLQVLTDYSLFVDDKAYETVSRPMFNDFMPFLMQYNVSVRLRETAKDRCCAAGIETAAPSWAVSAAKTADSLTNPKPSLGKLHDQSVEREKAAEHTKATSKTVFRLLSAAQENYTDIVAEASDLAQGRLFSHVSTADVFLCAHLQLQMLPDLPDCAVAGLLKSKFPALLEYEGLFNQNLGALKLNVEPPLGKDAPLWIYHIRQILGWY